MVEVVVMMVIIVVYARWHIPQTTTYLEQLQVVVTDHLRAVTPFTQLRGAIDDDVCGDADSHVCGYEYGDSYGIDCGDVCGNVYGDAYGDVCGDACGDVCGYA